MCGITGIIDQRGIQKEELQKFTDSIKHRGPDAAGYQILESGQVGLGHRRLSILDLSEKGNQPMKTENDRYWIVFNGEVFNFQEIREELISKGYSFISDTDTEVVLKAYHEWGVECQDKFNGMWAFAIWDQEKKELFLSRDRYGIKPLYYLEQNGRFAFASETYAFKHLEGFYREFDDELVEVNNKNVFALEGSGYTLFKKIHQLLPGHYAKLSLSQTKVKQYRWYDIRDKKQKVPDTFEEQKKRFLDLFTDACRIRLISDVPVATALSGGLDSSSVYSMVKEIMSEDSSSKRYNPNSQKAFTAVFPGLEVDEQEYAEKAAAFVDGDIYLIETPEDQLISRLENDTQLSDFITTAPITSISSVYRGMRDEGIRVSMDGHGVDEMLFGYRDMISKLFFNALKTDIRKAENYKNVLVKMFYENQLTEVQKKYENLIFDQKNINSSLKGKLKSLLRKNSEDLIDFDLLPTREKLSDKPLNGSSDFESDLLKYEFFVATLPTLLRNFDRAGMINGIEIRMPFMDYRLVEYCFSLPVESKVANGFTKLILRESMRDKMDESVRTRTFKVGIGSPFYKWLEKDVGIWAMDHLENEELKTALAKSRVKGIVDRKISVEVWKEVSKKLIQ
ncbi:MAG: asparagine synthase (glutamine-hydrolyzing) [Crocinitomicaceae bacterium]